MFDMHNMKGLSVMKKYLSILLALILLLTHAPLLALAEAVPAWEAEDAAAEAAAEAADGEEIPPEETEKDAEAADETAEDAEENAEEAEEQKETVLPEELLVGHPTVMKGDFFTEMFGNDTADIDVRALIHGYNLVHWDEAQGTYVIDTSVVSDVRVISDVAGGKTYYLALHEDLYYSDGTPITAWDYAFSLLLMMSPEIEEIGGKIYRAEHILGYNEYITKKVPYLTGVQVLTDHQLSITLDSDFLPYFFEEGLLLCVPYPISEIAPGCKVYDKGDGVYIGNEDETIREPIFTAELLRKTIMDPETGYNSHPRVVSGPYELTAFDGVTAHFEKNPYFKGTMDGVIPEIEKISFTVADNDTLVQQLKDGELHLVNKVVYGPTIQEGLQSGMRFSNYPRIGLAFLTFTYDWPTVHEKEVRQAIAWCMDRDGLTEDYCQYNGFRVDGYYGIEQWEYLICEGRMDYPTKNNPNSPNFDQAAYDAEVATWDALSLDHLTKYTVDINRANALLDQAQWTLNREGKAYRPGVDDVRCKRINGEIVALDLSMMYPEGNHIVDTLQERFIDNLNKCGIKLTLVPTPMLDLFYSYYRETERTTDMIYLATNFHVVVDPAITYSNDTTANHEIWNNTYSDDEELYQRAVDMRKTEPGSVYEYVTKWIRFQERYNEVLPAIPIYSNIYFDFFTPLLQNYNITSHVTWTQAILEAYFATEARETAPAQEEENTGDDEMFFD